MDKLIATIGGVIVVVGIIVVIAMMHTVTAGHVGVLVDLYGTNKGVQARAVGPGRYFLTWNQQMYDYPTFMETYKWTKDPTEGSGTDQSITFQTKEGLVVNSDIGITFQIEPDKAAEVFQEYRMGLDGIADTFLRNMVRDSFNELASDHGIEEIYGTGRSQLIHAVLVEVQQKVGPIGIKVDTISYLSSLRMPESVVQSINAKIQATQMAQQRENEVAQARAEADKAAATADGEARSIMIKAQAQAKANQILAASLSPELVQYKAIEQWDGHLSQVSGTVAMPFLNLNGKPPTQ